MRDVGFLWVIFFLGQLVYPGFTPLDVFGPFDFLQRVSADYPMTLSTISKHTGPVSSLNPSLPNTISWSVVATHDPTTAPPIDLLMVPGGAPLGNETWMFDFIAARFADADVVASICSGADSLARAGVLDGKRATTNKRTWEMQTKAGKGVVWVPSARWVRDGKVWSSSGVAAGMDMTYALLKWMYGSEKIDIHFNNAEYAPHVDPDWDPYSKVYNVPGANYSGSYKDVVGPIGYE
ncbi:class I glutamine amidotransferase-like protein [Periconia macrospinosa]|uniref:Class I glutamine amidotransferase-like protein n=1 Tax=Periconia macrospinosa TaxID=97972 RepID=A0A2V1DRF3_9PLEO|nr:class I glutamine amidotransferase-like protein [Periconia macrospinosa]